MYIYTHSVDILGQVCIPSPAKDKGLPALGTVQYCTNMETLSSEALLFQHRGELLRLLANKLQVHCQGLSQAARIAKGKGMISSKMFKKMRLVDEATSVLRHITMPSCTEFLKEVDTLLSTNPPSCCSPKTAYLVDPTASSTPCRSCLRRRSSRGTHMHQCCLCCRRHICRRRSPGTDRLQIY